MISPPKLSFFVNNNNNNINNSPIWSIYYNLNINNDC
jgi:hypothetical protein